MREIGHDRQHPGWLEPYRVQFLAVELRIPEGEIDPRGVDAELTASLETLLRELLVHVHEKLGRRDVVIDENLAVGHGVSDT